MHKSKTICKCHTQALIQAVGFWPSLELLGAALSASISPLPSLLFRQQQFDAHPVERRHGAPSALRWTGPPASALGRAGETQRTGGSTVVSPQATETVVAYRRDESVSI